MYQTKHGSKAPLAKDVQIDDLFMTLFVQPEPVTWIRQEGKDFQLPAWDEWRHYQSNVETNIKWDDIPLNTPITEWVEQVICTYCGSKGTLAKEGDKIPVCPRCGFEDLIEGHWIT
jgi:hypothetical protein